MRVACRISKLHVRSVTWEWGTHRGWPRGRETPGRVRKKGREFAVAETSRQARVELPGVVGGLWGSPLTS